MPTVARTAEIAFCVLHAVRHEPVKLKCDVGFRSYMADRATTCQKSYYYITLLVLEIWTEQNAQLASNPHIHTWSSIPKRVLIKFYCAVACGVPH